MIDSKNYIGMTGEGTHIFQEIKDGVIRGFNGYDVVETVDGERGLECVQWTHSETIDGVLYETGQAPAPTVSMPDEIDGLYEINTVSCESCGGQHDSEGDGLGRTTFVIVNECEVYCRECVKSSDLLVEIKTPADLFKARDIEGVDLDGYEEIETLFCDSSGFGKLGERALTKSQALAAVEKLMSHKHGPFYCGITGIGQFQVYVTIYREIDGSIDDVEYTEAGEAIQRTRE